MDVRRSVLGTVELHHPVDRREVDAARGDVGAEEHGVVFLNVVVVGVGAHGLLLLAVEMEQRNARLHATEGFEEKANLLPRGGEDEDFAAKMRFDEAVEELDLAREIADDVSLCLDVSGAWKRHQSGGSGVVVIGIHIDRYWI